MGWSVRWSAAGGGGLDSGLATADDSMRDLVGSLSSSRL
jgi:hypothetical protein